MLKVLGVNFNVHLSRALAYSTRVYVSFIKSTVDDHGKASNPLEFWMKPKTCFYDTLRSFNKLVAKDNHVPKYCLESDIVQRTQIQIGNQLRPGYPITSSIEAFYLLNTAFQLHIVMHNHVHLFNIQVEDFSDHKFVIVLIHNRQMDM